MKAWFDLAREMETRPGVLAASNFPIQPWLDVPEGGWAVAVVTDDDAAMADRLATELADHAWARRADFCRMDSPPPAEAVRRAYVEGASYLELSEHYAVPLNTMRTWLRRSLLQLRKCLSS